MTTTAPRWKGIAVHKVLEDWLVNDDCTPEALLPRARALLKSETIHPMLRALWAPRLIEAINQVAERERETATKDAFRSKAEISGRDRDRRSTVNGKADRIDRLADGGLAIVDYKTGKAPAQKAVDAGFALQLGLLGLIARAGGFPDVAGEPEAHEYWSLTKDRDSSASGFARTRNGRRGIPRPCRSPFPRRRGKMADGRRTVHGQAQSRLTRPTATMIS